MENPMNMNSSAQINELITALAKAQGKIKPAVFNKINSFYTKSKYADFKSCMEACREPISENGLAIIQSCQTVDGNLVLVTLLAHTSGQWISSIFPLLMDKQTSQGLGSAVTYAKRYSLCAMIGIVADEDVDQDDDGEAAVGRGKTNQTTAKVMAIPKKVPIDDSHWDEINKIHEKISDKQCQEICNKILELPLEKKQQFHGWLIKDFNIHDIKEITKGIYEKICSNIDKVLHDISLKKLEMEKNKESISA